MTLPESEQAGEVVASMSWRGEKSTSVKLIDRGIALFLD